MQVERELPSLEARLTDVKKNQKWGFAQKRGKKGRFWGEKGRFMITNKLRGLPG